MIIDMPGNTNFAAGALSAANLDVSFWVERKARWQTQAAIAKRVGRRRQAIAAFEAGENVANSTWHSLHFARGTSIRCF